MSKYAGHKYTWTKEFGWTTHLWQIRSQHGAIHFHVSVPPTELNSIGVSAGLEFHSIYPRKDHAPDHINCPFTGGRCWHDGTSSYAIDSLWPRIAPLVKASNHESIFVILEVEMSRLEPELSENLD